MIYRRQRQQYIFAILLGVVAVLNILFYFILTRPSRTEYAELKEDISKLELQIAFNRKALADLDKTTDQLGKFGEDKSKLMDYFLGRRQGYSEVIEHLNDIVVKSGVKKTHVAYNLDPKPQAGLNPLSITIPLEGNYKNVVQFIREVEKSETIYLITGISVARSSQAEGQRGQPTLNSAAVSNGNVALALSLETYFYQ